MAICQATTSAGRPCDCKARDGYITCGRHKNHEVGLLVLVHHLCGFEKADGTRCHKLPVEGDKLCKLHCTVFKRREQTRRRNILWGDALDLMWSPNPPQTFNEISAPIDDAYDRGWITYEASVDLLLQLHEEWVWMRRERHVPAGKTTTDLQRIAFDAQNVHTKEVFQQMTTGMKFLLETPIPVGQDTLAEIETAWSGREKKAVMKDIRTWYGTKFCVTENDWMYKRMLDGLWARIKSHKERTELTQRLWEESFESVGKCCQGHLSRLTNVMVGFTEEVKAEVPMGELLQQKIAAIAAKEIGVEFKVCEAWAVFEELKVPMEERDAWIEAF